MSNIWKYVRLVICGLVIGVANVIPGVSGGTMAVVMGIYDNAIYSVSHFKDDVKGNLLFLVPVALGMGIGVLGFASIVKYLLANHPVPTNFFFIGLVLGSIPFVFKKSVGGGYKPSVIITFLVCLAAMVVMSVVETPDKVGQAVWTVLSLRTFILLFLASVAASAAMIMPGISGSFLMLVFGTYATVISAISFKSLNIPILIPVALGVAVGLVGGVKIIDLLLKRFPRASYAGILGLMLGSIVGIFPRAFAINWTALVALGTLAAGAALAYVFSPKEKDAGALGA